MYILVVGNINSVHIQNFTKSLVAYGVQQSNPVKLDAIHIHSSVDNDGGHAYEQIFIPNAPLRGLVEKIPKFRALIKFLKRKALFRVINSQLPKYDCVIFHGFWKKSRDILDQLKSTDKFIVGAFWGSDFYRRSGQNDQHFQRALNRCDRIIISTEKMKEVICQQFNIDGLKIRQVLFGVQALQHLFDYKDLSRTDAKERLLNNGEDFVITCGYCARPEMRHVEMIASINKVKDYLPKNYLLLFPMTYSGSAEYVKEIMALLRESQLHYKVLIDFLSDEEIVYLRKATDIFIQIQTTDANSGSMQEHLVAQNIVVTGSWLPYQEYKDRGIYFETVDSPEKLSGKISEVLSNWQSLNEKVRRQNLPDKFRSSLWSEAIKDWYQVLTGA